MKSKENKPTLHSIMQSLAQKNRVRQIQHRDSSPKKYTLPTFLKDAGQAHSQFKSITKRTPSQLLGALFDGISDSRI